MVKKALSLIAALAFTFGSTVSAFADYSSGLSTESAAKSVLEDSGEIDESLTEVEKAESFALENDDPQYGKYLDSLSQTTGTASAGALSRSSGYTNPNLVHNTKFDGYDKLWGIDVSYFQYDIDWKKVKAAGIDFAIIRVGYRGYGSGGQLVLDYKFKENIQGAINAGLEVGVYFYTQAINTTEAVAEADFVLSYIKDYQLDLPVYYDIESVDYDTGRLDSANLTKAQKTALCTAFCDRIKSKGYDAGVYANMSWLTYQIDGAALGAKYKIWLAHYTTKTSYTGVYNTWQFTGSGSISGINTAVDMNVEYRDPNASVAVGKVQNVTLTPNGEKATITWDAAKGAEKYKVYRYDPSTKTYTNLIITANRTASVTLRAGNYAYCVRAYKTVDGEKIYGEYSDLIYADKTKVTGLTASADESSVKLAWSAVPDASGYNVYRAKASSTDYSLCGSVTNASFTETGLSSATGYSYKVCAYFGSGTGTTYGADSDPVTAVTLPKKTNTPTLSSSDSTSLSVSWNKLENVSGYQVAFYSSVSKTYTVKATVSASANSAKITGLTPNSTYKPVVRGYVDVNGTRYYGSYSSYKTCYTSPAAPQNMYATVNSSTITLTWDAVSGADKYTVYRKNGNSFTAVGTVSGTSYSIAAPGGYLGMTYTVKASSTKSGSAIYSAYSNETSFITKIPAAPVFVARKAGATSVALTWSKVSDVSGYRLYRYDPIKKTYINVKTVSGDSNTSYTVTGLSSGESYKFKIKAYRKGTSSIIWGNASSVYSASTLSKSSAALPKL